MEEVRVVRVVRDFNVEKRPWGPEEVDGKGYLKRGIVNRVDVDCILYTWVSNRLKSGEGVGDDLAVEVLPHLKHNTVTTEGVRILSRVVCRPRVIDESHLTALLTP